MSESGSGLIYKFKNGKSDLKRLAKDDGQTYSLTRGHAFNDLPFSGQ